MDKIVNAVSKGKGAFAKLFKNLKKKVDQNSPKPENNLEKSPEVIYQEGNKDLHIVEEMSFEDDLKEVNEEYKEEDILSKIKIEFETVEQGKLN